MRLNRRQLLQSTAAVASGVSVVSRALQAAPADTPPAQTDWSLVREDFPWLKNRLWLTAADYHPIGIHSLRAMETYLNYRTYGPGEGRSNFRLDRETKELFAKLINAKPNEIGFVQSTTDAENIVVSGMRLGETKGNVVIDDLSYQASKFLYHMLEKEGRIELRVIQHHHDGYWRVDPADMEKAIDRNTKLVSTALVSNINGYLHDIKKTAEIAHAHGAYVYADIIQGAGQTPIDVRAMGIDFAGCGAYKWLMGDFGFGYIYVREDLQDTVVKRSRYGVRGFTNPNRAQADSQFTLRADAGRYESGSLSNVGAACSNAALQYIHKLGVANMRAYVKTMTDRLQKEVPQLGYQPMTPPDNATNIVSFLVPKYEETIAKINKAFGGETIAFRRFEVTSASGEVSIVTGMRISPSIYNNQGDIDRLLNALA